MDRTQKLVGAADFYALTCCMLLKCHTKSSRSEDGAGADNACCWRSSVGASANEATHNRSSDRSDRLLHSLCDSSIRIDSVDNCVSHNSSSCHNRCGVGHWRCVGHWSCNTWSCVG